MERNPQSSGSMMQATRRGFLLGSGAAALARAQSQSPVLPRGRRSPLDGIKRENIRITGIKLINLGYRLKPEEQWPDGDNNNIIWKTANNRWGIVGA